MPKQAVLLLAHGTPETVEQIPEYLRNVVSGRPLPQPVIEEIQRRYSIIGRSPLTEITLEQARLVEAELAAGGEVVPVYLTNATMETYFQLGSQVAGPLEQDDRLTSNALIDSKTVFGTESCVGCHYSAGICIGFRRDPAGNLLHDANGNKIPIFGENSNEGLTGNADFSWLLQLEPKARNPKN